MLKNSRADVFRLRIPWPPTANTYWRHRNNPSPKKPPIVHISTEGQKYRNLFKQIAMVNKLYGLKLSGLLEIQYFCCPPDLRKRDLSNLTKCTEDAMMDSQIILDDFQIERFSMERLSKLSEGLVEIVFRQLPKDYVRPIYEVRNLERIKPMTEQDWPTFILA